MSGNTIMGNESCFGNPYFLPFFVVGGEGGGAKSGNENGLTYLSSL